MREQIFTKMSHLKLMSQQLRMNQFYRKVISQLKNQSFDLNESSGGNKLFRVENLKIY